METDHERDSSTNARVGAFPEGSSAMFGRGQAPSHRGDEVGNEEVSRHDETQGTLAVAEELSVG